MRYFLFCTSFAATVIALSDHTSDKALVKRESGGFSCYNAGNIINFSALCPSSNYPTGNDGRNVMTKLYFALRATTVPDDTVYKPQENIICTIPGPTSNITADIGAGVGNGPASAHGDVTFSMSAPNTGDNSVCMFTEGTGGNKSDCDTITLARARELLGDMLSAPNVNCETCGRIPIRYPNVTSGGNGQGGILKLDVRSANNCIGDCVGPNSFSTATPSPSPSPSASASASAAMRLTYASELPAMGIAVFAAVAWAFGIAIFSLA